MKNRGWIYTGIFSLLVLILITINVLIKCFLVRLDTLVNSSIYLIQNTLLINVSKVIGIIFDTYTLVGISLMISIILFFKKQKKEALFFSISMLVGALSIFIAKQIIHRARPLNILVAETNSSFPSGHATIAIVFFGIILYLILKKNHSKLEKWLALIISLIMIILIGFTRIYLSAHWISDVLAGYCLGLFVLSVCILIYKNFNKKN